ncbi:hypothetical protein SRABI82_06014 [Priestia megaterium]|nr:hypothetical protein SRABI82_06014 [Priestia megaterium]
MYKPHKYDNIVNYRNLRMVLWVHLVQQGCYYS